MSEIHDVAVIGAGPGGSATAYFLAKQGLNVALIDKANFPRPKTCGDGLTPRALKVLREMGILGKVQQTGFRIDGIELLAPSGEVTQLPIPDEGNLPNFLVTIPRLKLDEIIFEKAQAAGAIFLAKHKALAIEQERDKVIIQSQTGKQIKSTKARIAVIATGANTLLLKQTGILPKIPTMILAARAYFEGVLEIDNHVQAHFKGIPLPGYGWVFPISESMANIGIGFWPQGISKLWVPNNARFALQKFLQTDHLKNMLSKAKPIEPIRGYPIRIDFPTARTYTNRVIAVGEAAGLVNPLTGEGIDFALESGQYAANFLIGMFDRGDFSLQNLQAYDKMLRAHFQRLFVFLNRIRGLYLNPVLLNRFVKMTKQKPELRDLLVNILLGNRDAADGVSARTIRLVLLGR